MAAAAGPLVGGILVADFGWRSVFVINIPIALVIATVAAAVRVQARHGHESQRIDIASAALVAAVLAAGVHTLVGVSAYGWTAPPTLVGFAVTATVGWILVSRERRTAHPIVPAAVARSVPVSAAVTLLVVTSGGMFGALFVATFRLQDVLRLNAFAAGVRVLPLTVCMVLGSPVASTLLRRYGPRRTAATGSALVVSGIVAMSQLAATSTGVDTGVAFALLGAGFAAVMVTATGAVVGDAPPGYAGVVGGLKQTAMNLGPTLGIAVAASIMLASRHGGVPALTTPAMAAQAAAPALLVLAMFTALGLVPALLLPANRIRANRVAIRTLSSKDDYRRDVLAVPATRSRARSPRRWAR